MIHVHSTVRSHLGWKKFFSVKVDFQYYVINSFSLAQIT